MSSERTLLVDFGELRVLVIRCVQCGSEVTVDVGGTGPLPDCCPCCKRAQYSADFAANLESYRSLLRSFSADKTWKVMVRLMQEP